MRQYLKALEHVVENGKTKSDRTGVGTISVFGYQMRFNLQEGFPATTTKKLAWKSVESELYWFMEGSNDERRLAEILHGTRDPGKQTIWTANAGADYWTPKAKFPGDLGRVYGVQWRHWQKPTQYYHPELKNNLAVVEEIDQLENLINGLKKDPFGRRHILSAWNPGELDQMALPPCHILSQFDVSPMSDDEIGRTYHNFRNTQPLEVQRQMDIGRANRVKTLEDLEEFGLPTNVLSCQLYQRSCDMFLGVPFNIASYSLLTHIIARECNLAVGDFIWTGGDCHIYNNHIEQVKEQMSREPKTLPRLVLPSNKKWNEYVVGDCFLEDYNPHPPIKAQMAV